MNCPYCGSSVERLNPTREVAMAIIDEVAEEHLLSPAVMIGPSRLPSVVAARDCAARRLRIEGFMLKEIGLLLGGRDHSTIVHALRRPSVEPWVVPDAV